MRDLTPLFEPRSVALVGASNDRMKWGGWFAITSRWISDVPSQIRSTRSSRHSRSTGCSRM